MGGILADEMGLGKTVMLLSLILKTKEAESYALTKVEGKVGLAEDDDNNRDSIVSERELVGVSSCEADRVSFHNDSNSNELQAYSYEETPSRRQRIKSSASSCTSSEGALTLSVNGRTPHGTTLVVAPLSLVSQWEEELASKTYLSYLVYYDLSTKKAMGVDSFSCVDVVVTTCK